MNSVSGNVTIVKHAEHHCKLINIKFILELHVKPIFVQFLQLCTICVSVFVAKLGLVQHKIKFKAVSYLMFLFSTLSMYVARV